MKKMYGIENNFKKPCLKCPLCASEIANYDLLDRHLLPNHGVVSKYQHLKFGSKKTFEEWKLDFEKNTKSSFRFYDSKKWNNEKDANVTKYICHRSGIYGTQQKTLVRQRGMKLKGTNKIGLSLSSTYDREGGG
jgi:hypothetical protein